MLYRIYCIYIYVCVCSCYIQFTKLNNKKSRVWIFVSWLKKSFNLLQSLTHTHTPRERHLEGAAPLTSPPPADVSKTFTSSCIYFSRNTFSPLFIADWYEINMKLFTLCSKSDQRVLSVKQDLSEYVWRRAHQWRWGGKLGLRRVNRWSRCWSTVSSQTDWGRARRQRQTIYTTKYINILSPPFLQMRLIQRDSRWFIAPM